jgi:hypothetical protein
MRLPVVLISLAISIAPALAHDAGGWKYGNECCHERDCHRMATPPKITWDGFQFADGEFISKTDGRIKTSGDQDFHECRHMTFINGRQISGQNRACVYVPKLAW